MEFPWGAFLADDGAPWRVVFHRCVDEMQLEDILLRLFVTDGVAFQTGFDFRPESVDFWFGQ
jgi:hypothetical protein